MSFLTEIVAHKREEVRLAKNRFPEGTILAELGAAKHDFVGSLRGDGLAVIAEVKRASPSKGPLAPALDLPRLVREYTDGGAAAISVLTEGRFFGGSLADLRSARQATALPLLRKDFILDPYQVIEASWAEADAVLLIAACLDQAQLEELVAAARELRLGVLIETHTEAELDRVVDFDGVAIGLNSRDLSTFHVDLQTAMRLLPRVPRGMPVVAESGITNRREAKMLAEAGADAVLVGEILVKAADPITAIKELRGEM